MAKLLLILLLAAATPLAAQTNGRQLQAFATEAEAFNRDDPFANAFRAGLYKGYLNGMLETLQNRTVCFQECRCELDKLVANHLAQHPEIIDRPVAEWLVPLLEATYPCSK